MTDHLNEAAGRPTRRPLEALALLLAALAVMVLAVAGSATQAAAAETFGRWTAHTDFSEPGEKLCWLENGELIFVLWTIEADGYRGEWLTRHDPGGAPPPVSFFAEVETLTFSGEDSVGGDALVGAMKAGLTLDYQYVDVSGSQSGSISLIGFTKGYSYCDEQVAP